MRLSKLFSVRSGLIVMFSLLMVSYGVLAVFYINSLYDATQPSSEATVDVMQFARTPEGYTIEVPKVITAGDPFDYHIEGKKLVDVGADIRQQITCEFGDTSSTYTLGTYYSDQPKGDFNVTKRSTIDITTRLQSSKSCTMQSVVTYIFYKVDKGGNETSFTVREVADSNPFELRVPEQPTTKPSGN